MSERTSLIPNQLEELDVLGSIFQLYLYGCGHRNEQMKGAAYSGMRAASSLLAKTVELDVSTVQFIAEELVEEHAYLSGINATGSWVKARFAEGIYWSGDTVLAQQIADSGLHPEHEKEVSAFFNSFPTSSSMNQ
jgi:hypothetical protein